MRPKNPKSPEDILHQAIPLFAKAGFSGVSMREIARASGISSAALYHHFQDKEDLYISAVNLLFSKKSEILAKASRDGDSPEARLRQFIAFFIQHIGQDATFRAILQRELLEGDKRRLQRIADGVFKQAFSDTTLRLARELTDRFDPHLLAISIASLVIHHFQTAPLRPFLEGHQPDHDKPDTIGRHISDLLLFGVRGAPH